MLQIEGKCAGLCEDSNIIWNVITNLKIFIALKNKFLHYKNSLRVWVLVVICILQLYSAVPNSAVSVY